VKIATLVDVVVVVLGGLVKIAKGNFPHEEGHPLTTHTRRVRPVLADV